VWLVPAARIRFNRNDLLRMLALSVLWVAVPFTLFPIAEQWISSGLTGLLNGAMPIFAVTISSLMLARLPRRIQLLGLAVGFAGVGLIAFPGIAEGPSEATGVMLALLATVCYRLADSALAAGPLLATVCYRLADSALAAGPLLAVGALGVVGTGIAFVLMGRLVSRVGSARASFATYLIPVVAFALGIVFRGEEAQASSLIGTALVIVGAVLASRREA
jgi:drug/metabolite transporter (DMT)-like permease